MRSPTTLLLLIAVLLLGGYIALVERQSELQDRRQERARRALRFDPARVASLRLATPHLQVALEKETGAWRLVQPVRARADAGEVARILETLEQLVRSDLITGREQREQNLSLEDFGFTQPRARISLREGGRDMTLLIGRDTPLGGNMFVKVETENSVFVASTNLMAILPGQVADLRERQLFQGLPGEVARLDIRRADGLLQLARTDQGVWRMQKPYAGRASYAGVQELLNHLFEIRVVDFVADTIAAASLYGLDEPVAQVTLAGGRAQGEQVLRLGRPVESRPQEIYATLEGFEHVFSVPATLLDTLAARASELRDRRLLTLPAHDIGYIRMEEEEHAIGLARADDSTWSAQEPRQFKVSSARMQAVLSEWTGLRIETFIDNPGTNLAKWGLSPPARRITFARRAPAPAPAPVVAPAPAQDAVATAVSATAHPDDSVTVLVAREETPDPNLVLVKLANEEPLYRVSRDGLAVLPMDSLYFRDPVILALEGGDIRSLSRSVNGEQQTVERTSATAEFKAMAGQAVDSAGVSNVLAALQQVSADDFVVEDPEVLETWGLAQPRAALSIGLSGQGALGKAIIIGDDAGPDTVFAMLRGQGLVFTLPKRVRDHLLSNLYQEKTETAPIAQPEPSTRPVPGA